MARPLRLVWHSSRNDDNNNSNSRRHSDGMAFDDYDECVEFDWRCPPKRSSVDSCNNNNNGHVYDSYAEQHRFCNGHHDSPPPSIHAAIREQCRVRPFAKNGSEYKHKPSELLNSGLSSAKSTPAINGVNHQHKNRYLSPEGFIARRSPFTDFRHVQCDLLDDGYCSNQVYSARRVFIQPTPPGCSPKKPPSVTAARSTPVLTNGYSPAHNGVKACNGHASRPTYLCLTDDLLPATPPKPPVERALTPESPSSSSSPSKNSNSSTSKRGRKLHTISENVGSLLRPLRRSLYSNNGSAKEKYTKTEYRRCNSIPNYLDEIADSDSDNDDYGFLSNSNLHLHSSFPCASLSPAMQKAKASSTAQKIFTKKWRKSNKLGSSKSTPSLWRPEGSCVWGSVSGRKVVLASTNLIYLSEMERLALQKIALAKLQRMGFGCPITIPKEWVDTKRSKRTGFSLKRRTMSGGLLDNFKDKSKDKDGKDPGGTGWVFGLPLAKCVSNDLELRRPKQSPLKERRDSLDMQQVQRPCRKSSGSSGGAVSSDSLSESDSKSTGSNLLDALSLSSSSQLESAKRERDRTINSHVPHVPYAATVCFKYLETHGVHVLGIFRIGSSKKRTKQLRDEFDSGRNVKLDEEHSPHDVASLLKEFFRDLPDPLLTRDLYAAFIATRKFECQEKRLRALNLLVSLLPRANRDTLWALLNFLTVIVQHSNTVIDEHGNELPGNKMGSHNLATLFGPNILNTAKGGEFQVETLERAEERQDIIAITKEIIDFKARIFEVPVDLYDEVMRLMQETNPEAVDHLLRQKSTPVSGEVEPGETTSSSIYEESESSASVPHSPSYSSGDTHHHQPPALVSLRVPVAATLSAPPEPWQVRGGSPGASPRISPSPKAMRHSTLGVPSAAAPVRQNDRMYAAPPNRSRWYLDSPPSSPKADANRRPSSVIVTVPADEESGPLARTSSSHRPLGLMAAQQRRPVSVASLPTIAPVHNVASLAPASPKPAWHTQRWKHWQQLAADSSEDFHEQETLV